MIKVNPKPEKGYCACGLPLHYTDKKTKKHIEALVSKVGEFIKVKLPESGGRTFLVQRHYIALHGIDGKTLENLGFNEVKNEK